MFDSERNSKKYLGRGTKVFTSKLNGVTTISNIRLSAFDSDKIWRVKN